MREPTYEEIDAHAAIETPIGTGYACWYPQMGGYVGKCVIVPLGGCFEAYVWHDGDFPFSGENPARLHHCEPGQFVAFGEFAASLLPESTDD